MKQVVTYFFLCLSVSPAIAQRDAKIPDSDPEIERKSFIVAPGFEVSLWAADPLLAKPIQMNWDPQGRLWVATSETYPQIQPGQKANDKIIILEDTKGTGVADKTTVFADGLLIPTGIEPGDGGAYVANSTELIHLSTSKPGGKADVKKVLLSGFGTEDTHHIIHTFRWGPDGCLYFNQSIYIHSHIETPAGVKRLNAGGIWRYNTKTNDLNVFARGWVNPWGHVFDKYGQSFVTDGAGGEGINHVVPGAYYLTSQGPLASRILHGMNPGSPKYCGLEMISGRHFPDDWQGNLITNDFRGHRVCRFVLSENGSTYSSREMPELIKTNHPAFRPIDVKMGPDGAIYIADWYNPIIQHGEVDFRDPRRDHTHGRIWRVTAKGRPLVPKPKLVGATVPELLERTKDPEEWTKTQARRVYMEQTHFVPKDNIHLPSLLKMIADDNPRMRLYGIREGRFIETTEMVERVTSILDKPMDPTLEYALWLTLRELESIWLPAFQKGELTFGGDPKKIAFALSSAQSPDAVKPLAKLLAEGKFPKEKQADLYHVLTNIGGPEELAAVLNWAPTTTSNPRDYFQHIAAVEQAVRNRKVGPPKDTAIIGKLIEVKDTAVSANAMKIAGLWKLPQYRDAIESAAKNSSFPLGRDAAIEAVAAYGDPKAKTLLKALAEGKEQPESAQKALIALIGLDASMALEQSIKMLDDSKNVSGIVTAYVSRRGGGATLAKAIQGKSLPADSAKVAIARIQSAGANEPALIAALTAAGKLNVPKPYPTEAEIKSLTTEVIASGNAARGEAIYRRSDMQCLKCHAIAGAGGLVGPDMTSLGASAQVDYLVESLLNPNAKVKEGYNAIQVTTLAGKQYQGVKIREADGVLVIRNAEDKEESIRVDDIDARKDSRSLMPDGLTDPLTKSELIDLVKFLSELGKVGPYAPSTARLFRKWEYVDGTGTNTERMRRTRITVAAEKENGLEWTPTYTKVSGELPLSEISKYSVWQNTEPQSVIRSFIDVSQPGTVRLKFNDVIGLSVFVNGKPTDGKTEFDVDLPAGQIPVTMIVDRVKRKTDLKLELIDVPGSPARAKSVVGK